MCLEPLSLATTAEWGQLQSGRSGYSNLTGYLQCPLQLDSPQVHGLGVVLAGNYLAQPVSHQLRIPGQRWKAPTRRQRQSLVRTQVWVPAKDILLPLSSLFWRFSFILTHLLLGTARHTYTHSLLPFSCSPQQVLSQTVLEQSFCLSLLSASQCELPCPAEGSYLVFRSQEGEDQCVFCPIYGFIMSF